MGVWRRYRIFPEYTIDKHLIWYELSGRYVGWLAAKSSKHNYVVRNYVINSALEQIPSASRKPLVAAETWL